MSKLRSVFSVRMLLSLIVPVLLILLRPMGMDWNQGVVAGTMVLAITWWSTGLVGKIPSSCLLLLVFALFGSAPLPTVFSFLLSDSFSLLILCYLFSQAIGNSHITEKTLEPILFHYINTSFKALLSIILVFVLTMYIIPQPLARLIIVTGIYRSFLDKTDTQEHVRTTLIFAVFVFYAIVNMSMLDADIIVNTSAVGFAQLDIKTGEWAQYMAAPVAAFTLVALLVFCITFREAVFGIRLTSKPDAAVRREPLTGKEKGVLAVVVLTVALWATSGWHGIHPSFITLGGTIVFFAMGVLTPKDFRAIDITTLVFLCAAFSIGGVMKASGTADIVFSQVARIFPSEVSVWYIAVIIIITMGMHLILGSNTTTLSVVVPGLLAICGGILPANIILFIIIASLGSHYLLPFHSVAMMIGIGNGFFPAKNVTKFGIPMMITIFLSIIFLYLPWWRLRGFL